MSIHELDLYCSQITSAKSIGKLRSLRATIVSLWNADAISDVVFTGLNQDIRDRADWLRGRR